MKTKEEMIKVCTDYGVSLDHVIAKAISNSFELGINYAEQKEWEDRIRMKELRRQSENKWELC